MQQLNAQDAMFAYMEKPNSPLNLAWLNVYDRSTASHPVDLDAVREHVERRLHTVRFFRQKLVLVPGALDEPYWVDDEDFNLDHHIHHTALPGPGDWQQFCTLVARLFAKPFDFAKPLWEFYLIDGLDNVAGFPRDSFAILAKLHHAAVDGVSGVDVTTNLHTPTADSPSPEALPWSAEKAPARSELVKRAVGARVARPRRTVQTIARGLPQLRAVKSAMDSGELNKPPRHKLPRTRFSGPNSAHRVVTACRFRVDELKQVRALVPGATLNDVAIAIVGGALRRYLLAHKELPPTTLVATCPISLRTEEEQGTFGNRIANMFIALGTDVADSRERLSFIHKETSDAKGMNQVIGARTLAELSELVPGALVSLGTRVAARITGTGAANTTVTNVPGPQKPLYLAGAKLETQFLLGPLLDGMGIFHAIWSYCGELTMTVTADRDKLPDPAFYAECLQASIDELRAPVG